MVGFWLERVLELLLARRGQGAEAIILALIGWLAVASLILSLLLALMEHGWWSGFFAGTFDTLLALALTRDWKVREAPTDPPAP